MAEEYVPFDDALKALRMPEAELRAMVAQGKLRAFRDDNMLKFRKGDVETLRKQRAGGDSTLIVKPPRTQDTAVPQMVTPRVAASNDILSDETVDYDDTADTIVGGDLGLPAGDLDLALDSPPISGRRGGEPSTKVPTIELTSPDTGTEDTEVPTLDLGDVTDKGTTSDTEVPTMVLGLDEYDDTQVATEDVATEEVSLEPGELGREVAESATPDEQAQRGEEELKPDTAAARMTPASAFGTGEALILREQPSALYTVMSAITAFVLLVPGSIFFYCVISSKVPDWEILKSVSKFFWDLLGPQ